MATTNEIISRIKTRLSRPTVDIDAEILDALKQVQEDLEGKPTLPSFLVKTNDDTLLLPNDDLIDVSTELDESFIRFHDDEPVKILNPNVDSETEPYLPLARFVSEEELKSRHPGSSEAPRGWAFTYPMLIVRPMPSANVTIRLKYYYHAPLMAIGNTTIWTQQASQLLIGMAGAEVAQAKRDKDAAAYFQGVRTQAWRDYVNRGVAEEVAGLHSSRGED